MDKNTEARERLTAAVAAMSTSEGFAAYLRTRAAFHDYSFGNVCLIAYQRPAATRVAGYKAWQKLGRQVRKGEVGIRILAPCPVKHTDAAGEETRALFFRTVSVFDVAQTEGDPLPELDYRPLEGDAVDLADHLCGIAMREGLEIRRENTGDANGYLSRGEKLIAVSDSLSGAMSAKVVAHELGHYFDPFLIESPAEYAAHRGDCEAVAESVAYVICAAYGIDAGPSAIGYVTSWTDGNADRVKDLAHRIDASVKAILTDN